jgi:hypothetical protein
MRKTWGDIVQPSLVEGEVGPVRLGYVVVGDTTTGKAEVSLSSVSLLKDKVNFDQFKAAFEQMNARIAQELTDNGMVTNG